jgi:hypothetical protein
LCFELWQVQHCSSGSSWSVLFASWLLPAHCTPGCQIQ